MFTKVFFGEVRWGGELRMKQVIKSVAGEGESIIDVEG